MNGYFFSARIDEERTLFLAPLTERRKQLSTDAVTDCSGYFLFEKRGKSENAEIEIIARVETDEAALRLKAMLGLD